MTRDFSGEHDLKETDLDALEASEKTCTHLERQRLGDAHIVWGWAPVRKVVRIANPLEEVQFIRFQRGFRWLQVPMAPCHDDYCPSRSRHACQLTNKLIKESGSRYTSSRKTRKFTRKERRENNPNYPNVHLGGLGFSLFSFGNRVKLFSLFLPREWNYSMFSHFRNFRTD